MSFQKFKTIWFCVGQKHYFGTKNIDREVTFNKKTGKEIRILVGQCSLCNRKYQWLLVIIIYQQKTLVTFSVIYFKKDLTYQKGGKNVLENLSRAMDNPALITTADASKNPKNVLSTLNEVINFNIGAMCSTCVTLFNLYFINGTKNRQIIPISTIRKRWF